MHGEESCFGSNPHPGRKQSWPGPQQGLRLTCDPRSGSYCLFVKPEPWGGADLTLLPVMASVGCAVT
ncbi:hypothetical protein PBY51_002436 [Eleginops maclovinus]|uniref:Uncharacterized protein n=1 Tax=Eleginops maclovinus TaxID=56733 RepID=A0AAN8AFS7_ELEMC|nr:hypothetical protein PBY51_002436 [Eleginops maclovinus]